MLTWWQVEIQTIYIPLLVSWRTVTVGLDGNFDFVAAYGCYGKFNLYILVTIYDTCTYARMLTSTYHKVIPRTCSCFLRYLHIADVRYGLLHPETYLGLGWYFSRVRKNPCMYRVLECDVSSGMIVIASPIAYLNRPRKNNWSYVARSRPVNGHNNSIV